MSFHQDAKQGTLTSDNLSQYLQAGVDINAPDTNGSGFTPLAAAAKGGHVHAVRLLLENGASVNAKSSYGRTPLYVAANARANRVEIVQMLLNKGPDVDSTDPLCDNETPLMVAVTQSRDPRVVALLFNAGASVHAENFRGETAKSMADISGNPKIRSALLPDDQQRAGLFEFVNVIVNLVLFIMAYVNSGLIKDIAKGVVSTLYRSMGTDEPDRQLAENIGNPTTVDDFKSGLEKYVEKNHLNMFFSGDNNYIEKVAEKVVALRDDPKNYLNKPDQITGLTRLAMYQPVFYCDDSGSMTKQMARPLDKDDKTPARTRMYAQRELVRRMASIATRLVPQGSGAHLRFINATTEPSLDNLNSEEIDSKMEFEPSKEKKTNIGSNLFEKILKPHIYDNLDAGRPLQRPYLVLIITDGHPNPEAPDTLKKAIIDCGTRLAEAEPPYPQESVMFLISQVGDDPGADKFLQSLQGDIALERVLFRTAGRLDEKFKDLVANEKGIEEWLFNVLMHPILGRYEGE